MLSLAHALATGETPFECPHFSVPEACRVLIVEQELGEFGLQKRSKTIWTDNEVLRLGRKFEENLWYVSKVPELKLENPVGRNLLKNLVAEVKPNVLILDPIGRMHGYDENDAKSIAQLFNCLDSLTKANAAQGMSIILSHHFGKPKDPRMEPDKLDPYNFRGSSKFFDNPDALVTVDRYKELPTKHESWALKTRWTLRQGESPDDLIMYVNERADGRVRYFGDASKGGAPPVKFLPPRKEQEKPLKQAPLLFEAVGSRD